MLLKSFGDKIRYGDVEMGGNVGSSLPVCLEFIEDGWGSMCGDRMSAGRERV